MNNSHSVQVTKLCTYRSIQFWKVCWLALPGLLKTHPHFALCPRKLICLHCSMSTNDLGFPVRFSQWEGPAQNLRHGAEKLKVLVLLILSLPSCLDCLRLSDEEHCFSQGHFFSSHSPPSFSEHALPLSVYLQV